MVFGDMTYFRINPTFHHWHTGSCSYGLTFQSPSEAEAFAKAVDRCVEAIRQLSSSEGMLDVSC